MSVSRFYVVMATDNPGKADIRNAMRPAHRSYLRSQADVRIYSAGPLVEESGEAMNGTFVLCGADSLDSVEHFVAGDPYSQSGLFANVIIRRLNWTLGSPQHTQSDAVPSGAVVHGDR